MTTPTHPPEGVCSAAYAMAFPQIQHWMRDIAPCDPNSDRTQVSLGRLTVWGPFVFISVLYQPLHFIYPFLILAGNYTKYRQISSPHRPPNNTFALKHCSEPPARLPRHLWEQQTQRARRTHAAVSEAKHCQRVSVGEELRQDRLIVPSRAGCRRTVCRQLSAMVTEEAAGLERLGRGPGPRCWPYSDNGSNNYI